MICPSCFSDMGYELNDFGGGVCASCGYIHSATASDFEKQTKKTIIISLLMVAAIVLTAFFQIKEWDKHALSIIPIQLKANIGTLGIADLEARAGMCMDRKYYDCVEADYTVIARATRDPNMILRLGKFQMSRAKSAEASQTFQVYFQLGGADMSAQISYAKALGKTGNVEEAAKWYEQVLAAKPEVVQVTVIQNYVKLLIESNKPARAKKLVAFVQKNVNDRFMADAFGGAGDRTPASIK